MNRSAFTMMKKTSFLSTGSWIFCNKLWFMSNYAIILGITLKICGCVDLLDCSLGQFQCNNSESCVEQKRICDGVFDCYDESDEWNCDSEHQIEFWNRLFKKRPDEDSDKISNGKKCVVEEHLKICICQNGHIYCENRGLTAIPSPLPNGLIRLDLSSNVIEVVNKQSFVNLNKLEHLLLSNCRINLIEKGSFDKMKMLKKLYLTGNLLESIENETFRHNNQLQTLDLSFNHIFELAEDNFIGLEQLEDLDLRGNRLLSLKIGVFRHLKHLKSLYLNKNQILQISAGVFHHLIRLRLLYLTHNSIHHLGPQAFDGLSELKGLYLSFNSLEKIQTSTFECLSNLLHLDVSHNRLSHFSIDAFHPLLRLELINLKGNPFRRISQQLLQPLTRLTHIYFQEFYMCGYALHVRVCEPKSDGISSLENLLDNVILRVCVWIVAAIACVGNLLVLIGRLLINELNQVHSFYIKSLSVSDFLMGIYLFIIASYDVHFRGRYIQVDEEWRHSWQCQFSGFLSTLSSEASVFTLTVITYDRYFSISRPLSLQRRTRKYATVCTVSLWSVALIISSLPLFPIPYYGTEFYGNNGVCLPLHIHEPFSAAWEYSAIVFIAVNFFAFVFIFHAYIKMFLIIKDSTVSLRSTQEKQDRTIAQRFALIVGTDLLCWMPIIIIKILALCGIKIQDNLYAWLAIFVLPVNSALNPILYTLTTKLFRQQVWRWTSSNKSSSCGNSARNQPDSLGLSLSYVFFHRASWSKRTVQNQSIRTNSSGTVRSCGSRESLHWCRTQTGNAPVPPDAIQLFNTTAV
ncbi:Relaxin insulin-like peptide receptor [Chamberlinius hualienensis]